MYNFQTRNIEISGQLTMQDAVLLFLFLVCQDDHLALTTCNTLCHQESDHLCSINFPASSLGVLGKWSSSLSSCSWPSLQPKRWDRDKIMYRRLHSMTRNNDSPSQIACPLENHWALPNIYRHIFLKYLNRKEGFLWISYLKCFHVVLTGSGS